MASNNSGVLERIEVKSGTTVKDIAYFHDITAGQTEQIGRQASFTQNENHWQVRGAAVQASAWFFLASNALGFDWEA